MKRTFVLLSLIIICHSLFSQSIDETTLNKLKTNYTKTKFKDTGISNAISNNDIRSLALNRDISNKEDHAFKYKVKVSGITDQKSSGRCWMFAGLNSLRPYILKDKNLSNFEFSTNYLYFYDLLEKSNLFLDISIQNISKPLDDKIVEWALKNPIGDGGVWNSFSNLIEKYGLMPKISMPETYHSENSSWLNQILSRKLREFNLKLRDLKISGKTDKQINEQKLEMLSDIYRLLCLFLGEPPSEFSYRFIDKDNNIGEYKKYTAQSFFKELFPSYNSNNYVMLMNDPSRAYYKLYEIEYDRNVLEGKNWVYLNLPAEEIKAFAIASIKDNEAMYASCDVGKQLNKNDGTLLINNYNFEALLGVSFPMTKAERIKSFDSGSAHAMLLTAVDTDNQDKPTKWQFENSWGSTHGHNGYLTFSDEWFNEYMFRLVINKKYINSKTLNLLEQKPIVLPPWDPMFSSDY